MSLCCVLQCTQVFKFDLVSFVCFWLCCLSFWFHVKLFSSPISWNFSCMFSFRSFMTLDLKLFWVNIFGTRIQLHYFAFGYPNFGALFVVESVLPPCCGLGIHVEDRYIVTWGFISGLSFHSIGLHVCLYVSTTLFLLLWFYNLFWIQEVWIL